MSKGRFAGVVILAADRMQERFIRSWLKDHVSVDNRDIRGRLSDDGGSGKQFVRDKFPEEAESHRKISLNRGSMLIAVIDADKDDAATLYDELMRPSPSRGGMFVFVPKRNIETWLHQLTGHDANENESYKMKYKTDPSVAIRAAGKRFLQHIQAKSSEGLLPSLSRGVEEAQRMPRIHDPQARA